jgi:hypothetical protein
LYTCHMLSDWLLDGRAKTPPPWEWALNIL